MKYKVRRLCKRPNIFLIDDFLTGRECSTLISMALRRELRHRRFEYKEKNKIIKKDVPVRDLKFTRGANKTIATIEKRIEKVTSIPQEHGAGFLISHYSTGGYNKPHFDFMGDRTHPNYNRLITFLIYLNDVEEGGETYFPVPGLKVIPKKGRAVFWHNFFNIEDYRNPNFKLREDHDSSHGGMNVVKGDKWMIVNSIHSLPKQI